MNEFIKGINEMETPITVTQVEMNTNTSDKLLKPIPQLKDDAKISYGYTRTVPGIPIYINDELRDEEIKITYSDGKYNIILTNKDNSLQGKEVGSFKMEYESSWYK